MIDGHHVIDVHVHAPPLSTIKPSWDRWARFDHDGRVRALYGQDAVDAPALAAHLRTEGVDQAFLLSEYSPRVAGVQPFEAVLETVEAVPDFFRFIGNVNPHYHFPCADAAREQIDAGAVAVKVHGVHGAFDPGTAELYPTYALCEERGVPVIVHVGTSNFPGSVNRFADPTLMEGICTTFPSLKVVLAHGGRGWWYQQAASMVRLYPNVYIDIAGLPPQRLPHYYERTGLDRIASRMIFGSDWPQTPGIRRSVSLLRQLGLPDQTVRTILGDNARALYAADAAL